ncbi:hypothetical protein AAVH_15340 [Aphelenchoides avenae]|nr:hypothetical protein AAVH_15340 [Aphelenchus avenae]
MEAGGCGDLRNGPQDHIPATNGSDATCNIGRVVRDTQRLYFKTKKPDTAPLVVRDEALIDYLFAPEHAMCKREVDLSAFNASQTFIQKLINRAQQMTNYGRISLEVKHLSIRSQQLSGLRLNENEGFSEYDEQLENGASVWLVFGRKPPPDYLRAMHFEEGSDDKFRFFLLN